MSGVLGDHGLVWVCVRAWLAATQPWSGVGVRPRVVGRHSDEAGMCGLFLNDLQRLWCSDHLSADMQQASQI